MENLRKFIAEKLNVKEDDLIWSDKCNNPSKGFRKGIDNTQVAIAGQGYWVLK